MYILIKARYNHYFISNKVQTVKVGYQVYLQMFITIIRFNIVNEIQV